MVWDTDTGCTVLEWTGPVGCEWKRDDADCNQVMATIRHNTIQCIKASQYSWQLQPEAPWFTTNTLTSSNKSCQDAPNVDTVDLQQMLHVAYINATRLLTNVAIQQTIVT